MRTRNKEFHKLKVMTFLLIFTSPIINPIFETDDGSEYVEKSLESSVTIKNTEENKRFNSKVEVIIETNRDFLNQPVFKKQRQKGLVIYHNESKNIKLTSTFTRNCRQYRHHENHMEIK